MNPIAEVALGIFGVIAAAAIGSFMCVVIDRMPVLRDEPDEFGDFYEMRPWSEVAGGTSRCSSCGAPVRWFQNVPVVAWLVLRGRCASCKESIPAFHPIVELAVPLTAGLYLWAYGLEWRALPALIAIPGLIAVSAIDLRTLMVPTRVVWPTFALVLVVSIAVAFANDQPRWMLGGVIGIAILAGPLTLLWFALPGAMGFGDVRLAVLLGWILGFESVRERLIGVLFLAAVSIALSAGLGIVFGVARLIRDGRKAKVPFGPALVIGCLVVTAFSAAVLDGFLIS